MPQDKIKSINPATGEVIREFVTITDQQLEEKIQKAQRAFERVKNSSLEERSRWMANLADVLNRNIEKYARTVTLEMGKPRNLKNKSSINYNLVAQAIEEAEISAKFARWYSENAKKILCDKELDPLGVASRVLKVYEPLGVLYQIAPFNYPLWQVKLNY
jgi:succinate-semialdehyde dehydrogenase/glutarate-semialdehyde dehydrogenase